MKRPYPFNHLAALRHLRHADPRLADLIARVGRFQMPQERPPHPHDALLSAILYQQLHGAAAAAILARLQAQVGRGGFPAPEQILAADDAALRATGLSRQKIAALRDLAEKARAGVVPAWEALHPLEDQTIITRLTEVRGVGVWTVQMLLMFRLGRPDVLPVLDYGVRNGYRIAFRKRRMPTPKELEKAGECWRPYRSVASWYLWQAVRLEREQVAQRKASASIKKSAAPKTGTPARATVR